MRLYLHVCLCMNVHVHVSHFHVIARRPAPATRSPVVFFRNLLPFWLKIRAQANLLQIGITFAELKSRLHQAMVRFAVLFASLVVSAHSSALNPVRKVVTLLQSMQQKVQDEGTQELELYNRYMCHCRSGGADLFLRKGVGAQHAVVDLAHKTIPRDARAAKDAISEQLDHRLLDWHGVATPLTHEIGGGPPACSVVCPPS